MLALNNIADPLLKYIILSQEQIKLIISLC